MGGHAGGRAGVTVGFCRMWMVFINEQGAGTWWTCMGGTTRCVSSGAHPKLGSWCVMYGVEACASGAEAKTTQAITTRDII